MASCSAAGCHGGTRLQGGELSLWLRNDDPHVRAYAALLSDAANAMAAAVAGRSAKATQSAVCLACHSMDAPHFKDASLLAANGASCEACHGPAGNWIEEHAAWSKQPDATEVQRRAQLGFRDLKDIRTRAEACVRCHVGTTDAEVTHDIIAAGHPRLAFELGLYLDQLPKHWDAEREKSPGQGGDPALEARVWAVGQAVSAEAACRLIEQHAKGGRWPEFADFDCFACHHDLRDEKWRSEGRRPESLGLPRPAAWYFAAMSAAAREGGPSPKLKAVGQAIAVLGASTAKAGFRPAAHDAVARAAAKAGSALDGLAVELNEATDWTAPAPQLLSPSKSGDALASPNSWDEAAQAYLARWAAWAAERDAVRFGPAGRAVPKPPLELLERHRELEFPTGYNSLHRATQAPTER